MPHPSTPPFSMTRREFLAASATVTLSPKTLLVASHGDAATPAVPWHASMRRCGQINLNERDPLTLDVEAWMDYWASLKVDAVLLNGGGIVAFYPTEVPYHRRSPYLGSRDVFGEMVAAAKKRRMRVVARMDCNWGYVESLRAHPEWFEHNRDGTPRTNDESSWLYKTCMFSSYFTEQMPAIYREINQRYAVDGFFTNGWPSTGGLGVCYCENCQKIYRDVLRGAPPEHTDASSPIYRKYYELSMDRIIEIWKLWDSVVKEKQPDSVYVGNLGGGIHTVKSVKRPAEVAAWFNADHQGRSGNTPIWDCAQQGRVAQCVMNGRTITCVTGAYSNSSVLWRHTSKPPAEATMWMAQTAASGMVPWFHWLGGSPEDNRWRDVGRSFFQWLAEHEAHFRNRRSLANLAVLYPQSTIAFYGSSRSAGNSLADSTEFLQGLYYALLEGRFAFDFVHQENLRPETLKPYRALLIPNAAYLRESECDAIRKFAEDGGSVLATFETSRYNEWGDPRKDLALADLFGVSVTGEVIGPRSNGYMRIEQKHPVVEGFEGTALLPGAEYRLPVRQVQAGPLALSVVPAYPAFPPEMVYPRKPRTDEPAALFSERGAARIAYFAGDIDRTCWRSGSSDLSQLIQNSVRWLLAGERQPVTVTGDGLLEIFAWETEPGYALHLLNYTNPNTTRGFLRRFYPVGPQQVEFDVAPGRRISQVQALHAGRALPFKQSGDTLHFEVPTVVDYEVIALT